MDTRLNKTCSLYTACRYNNILSISVFVIQNDIEFLLYGDLLLLLRNMYSIEKLDYEMRAIGLKLGHNQIYTFLTRKNPINIRNMS